MHVEPLRTLWDALAGRRIRNSYREYMTGDSGNISLVHQIRWYREVYRPACARGEKYAWLFWEDTLVGYGGISLEDDRWWLTAGLVPEARGRGLGKQMFAFLTDVALGLRGEAWLRVHGWNSPARNLYERLDYGYVREIDDSAILTMVRENKSFSLRKK